MPRPPPAGTVVPPAVVSPAAGPHLPTSVVLEGLVRDAPAGRVTPAWLVGRLRARSFGVISLVLGVCALLPVVSTAAGLLLVVAASQMVRAYPAPAFPRRLAQRPFATDKLTAMLARVIPALRFLERFVRPRWPTPVAATRRAVGVVVLLLGLCLLVPVPLSNVPVGLTVVLVAFAHLEEDGVLLALALALALGLFAAAAAALWGTVAGLVWLAR